MTTDRVKDQQTLDRLKRMEGKRLTLADRVWSLRQKEGLHLYEYARILKVDPSYLTYIERGLMHPKNLTVYRWAENLGCSPADFVQLNIQDCFEQDNMSLTVIVKDK